LRSECNKFSGFMQVFLVKCGGLGKINGCRGDPVGNAIKLRDCRSALAEWIANNCTLKGTVIPHNLTLQGEGITNQEVTYSLNLIVLDPVGRPFL